MRKILISLASAGAVAALAFAATGAFFSDTETSTDNSFVAGDIDLQIDNTSYAIDYNIPDYTNPIGAFVANPNNSWTLSDLTVQKFFDFVDLKPGDYSEDTISLHVGSNDAWVCAAARLTADNDNTYTGPELADDQTQNADPTLADGELDENLNFVFWVDDGDNVLEADEVPSIFLSGPLSSISTEGQIALADSQNHFFSETGAVPGGSTNYIGKYWCFGNITQTPLEQDQVNTGNPLSRGGTGFSCDGSQVNNAAQTDLVKGDLQFYAVQSRNNPEFLCSKNYTPVWPTPTPTTPQ